MLRFYLTGLKISTDETQLQGNKRRQVVCKTQAKAAESVKNKIPKISFKFFNKG